MRKIILSTTLIVIITLSLIIFSKEDKEIEFQKEESNSSFISMMFEDSDGKYIEKTDDNFPPEGYLFNAEKSGCENGGILTWNKEQKKIEASLLSSDKCYAYFDKYNFTESCRLGYEDNLECYILINKDNTLIYHDGKADYPEETNYALEAEDFSYRYTGASENVNNYLCFGGDCSSDSTNENYANLYRIIGLFDDDADGYYNLKIIKADYATEEELGTSGNYAGKYFEIGSIDPGNGSYKGDKNNYYTLIGAFKWHKENTDSAVWATSELNTINLNDYFLNTYLGKGNKITENPNKWQQMLENHLWIVGGNNFDNLQFSYDSKKSYIYEMKDNADKNANASAYVGLMYLNDYRYAVNQEHWFRVGNDNDGSGGSNDYRVAVNENWLFLGLFEWTITRRTDISTSSFRIDFVGCIGEGSKDLNHAVRPTMYLKHNIKRVSGNGTKDVPFIIDFQE